MAEYIKREDIIKWIDDSLELCGDRYSVDQENMMELFRTVINDCIPFADVVEVVRCKDCAWCHAGYCEKYDDLIPFGCANKPWEDWFCADWKR